jgi:hypothetical protein
VPVRLVSIAPNPINPATTIEFELATRVEVRLDVIDAAGRITAMLVAGPRAAGLHAAAWTAADLPSGVYLCRPASTSAGSAPVRTSLPGSRWWSTERGERTPG